MPTFEVAVSAGTLRSAAADAVHFPHAWTEAGVAVEAPFTGGHLWVLAPAACVLNDAYREAKTLGVPVDGVRVVAVGGLDADTWASTGIEYSVEVDTTAPADLVAELLDVVDDVAEIPKALRAGGTVKRR